MADLKKCEFFLLRFVPDVVKGEFVNIGVVVLEEGADGFTGVRFTRDWRRARCLDPEADLELLQSFEGELQRVLESRFPEVINYRDAMSRRVWLLREMYESLSGTVELTPMKAIFTESPRDEIGKLAKRYLASTRRARRERSGRTLIYSAMRDAFEEAGIWESSSLLKKIAVADYTKNDDPLKIDCGYRPNGVLHLVHALSLQTDAVNSAKVLSFSYAAMMEGVRQKLGAETDLTVVTEDGLDRSDRAIGIALNLLAQDETVQTATVSDLPQIAEQARVALKL
jgi:hypothetical protein